MRCPKKELPMCRAFKQDVSAAVSSAKLFCNPPGENSVNCFSDGISIAFSGRSVVKFTQLMEDT